MTVIGYAPGAYDLFHVGHLNIIQRARSECDYLIAGVVTDIGDNFITIEVAENVRIRVQKGAVGNVLPTGTLKSAN